MHEGLGGGCDVLRRLGEIAARKGKRMFLVGGAVRDLIGSGDSPDLDVVIEGDAIDFARSAAHELNAEFVAHGHFVTATLQLPDANQVDVASARMETYSSPGALPDVELSTMEKDLQRRDFTINAMAASISPDDFGELLDPHGGMADLDSGILRVLHEKSFIDDPTRILRGIRFTARLGFRFHEETEHLLRDAVSGGAMDTVSGPRIRKELEYCFAEDATGMVVKLMIRYKLPGAIVPGLEFSGAAFEPRDSRRRAFDDLRDAMEEEELAEYRDWLAGLACAVYGVPEETMTLVAERLSLNGDARKVLMSVGGELLETNGKIMNESARRSQIAPVLSGTPLEALVSMFAMGTPVERERIATYITETRHAKLRITGDDLKDMGLEPSPETGRVMDELLRMKQDGVISGRREEKAAAQKLINRMKK